MSQKLDAWSCRFVTCFVTVFATVIAITKDLPDVEGDRKYNIDTLATRLGVRTIAFAGKHSHHSCRAESRHLSANMSVNACHFMHACSARQAMLWLQCMSSHCCIAH